MADQWKALTELVVRHVEEAQVGTRASIVAFLRAECLKFERVYNEHIASERLDHAPDCDLEDYNLKTCRLDSKVSILRTMIAYIERGDDMVPR